jgi:hypothetical protein
VSRRLVLLLGVFAAIAVTVVALVFVPSSAEKLVVKKVLIDVEPAAVANGVDREQIRGLAHDVLADIRGVVVDENAANGSVVRVRVESFTQQAAPADHPADASTSTLTLSVDVINDGRSIGRGHSVAAARGEMSVDTLARQALRDAVQQVQQVRAADGLDADTLLTWLSDPSSSVAQRRKAMQALASRGDRRATAALVALLERGTEIEDDDLSDDNTLAVAALQALAVLGDPDAVDAIIAFSERQPAPIRKLCIDAAKATQSPRAAPWLFTLSSGHLDSEVQAYARTALLSLAPDVLPNGAGASSTSAAP